MKTVQRVFFPGSEWVYLKIYIGRKAVDRLLVEYLLKLVTKLFRNQVIDKFFFIRYSDPDFHLRLRLHLIDKLSFGDVIVVLNKSISSFVREHLVYKVEISTYVREIERYGNDYMDLSESIFTIDSEFMLELLKVHESYPNDYKWMFEIMWLDMCLETFGLTLESKSLIMEKLSKSYRAEFGYTKYNAKQLNLIFRMRKELVERALSWNELKSDVDLVNMVSVCKKYQEKMRTLIKDSLIPLHNVISYLHMSVNRCFSIDNRVCELLIYDSMNRYYKSKIIQDQLKRSQKQSK